MKGSLNPENEDISNVWRLLSLSIIGFVTIFGNSRANELFLKGLNYARNLVTEHNYFKKILDIAFKHEYLDFNKIRGNLEQQTAIEWD